MDDMAMNDETPANVPSNFEVAYRLGALSGEVRVLKWGAAIAIVSILGCLGVIYQEIGALRQEVRQENGALRQEIREENGALRQEVREEIGALRQEVRQDNDNLRQDNKNIRQEIGSLRQDNENIRQEIGSLRSDLGQQQVIVQERLARVEELIGP